MKLWLTLQIFTLLFLTSSIAASAQIMRQAGQSDIDRLERKLDRHMEDQSDKEAIQRLEIRLAVLENITSANTRILWGVGGAILLQVLMMIAQVFGFRIRG